MLLAGAAGRKGVFLALLLASLVVLSYLLRKELFQSTVFGLDHESPMKQSEGIRGASETEKDFCLKQMRDGICQTDTGALCGTRMQERKEREVKDILTKLDQLMPNVTFTDIKTTTCAKNSKATIVNHQGSYCVGDHLTIRLDLFDFVGKKKEYGGDFLRARVYSASLKAGASGHIKDYRNGTYLVDFTLFWEGNVRVSLLLIHPSEGVSALWAARKKGYDKIAFTGRFLSGTLDVSTECGFNLTTKAELCEYLDERDGEAFYCVKPKNVPCDAFVQLMTSNKPVSYLTKLEQSLFHRNNIGVEIPQRFGEIRVLPCNRSARIARETCRTGMTSPIPSGYALHNTWHPQFCSVSDFSTLDKIHSCLKRKMIYLMGDSTLRQWIYYLTENVATLKFFDQHGAGFFKTHVALDPERHTFVQWKKHGHPFVTKNFFSIKDNNYVSHEIDRIPGDENTAVVIALGQHFRPFPMHVFVRRLLNIRRAVQRLLQRSPGTRVIIRTENIREMHTETELFGDINGYPQNLITKDIFQVLGVGFIDAWDMSIAYVVNNVHPPSHVVWNQIVMFLTYIWNKTAPSKQCSIGMRSPFPSGFVWQDQWYPVFCSMSNFGTLDQINNCLKRKLVYFMGDVTVRRWMEHLTNTVSTLKHFDIHETGKLQNLLAVDTARDIQIQWKKHGHPIITDYNCTVKDHSYVAREIDNLAGDGDTAVVISLGRNFRPFPIELFIRRAINVRAAIERLFLRSPDTKVILKAEDVREMQADPERFSNFHGYAQYLAAKNVFQNLNIGMVDAWDMTIAYATTDIQPPVYVVGNQINMFLTYLC